MHSFRETRRCWTRDFSVARFETDGVAGPGISALPTQPSVLRTTLLGQGHEPSVVGLAVWFGLGRRKVKRVKRPWCAGALGEQGGPSPNPNFPTTALDAPGRKSTTLRAARGWIALRLGTPQGCAFSKRRCRSTQCAVQYSSRPPLTTTNFDFSPLSAAFCQPFSRNVTLAQQSPRKGWVVRPRV